jgi:hypothetical protein
MPYKDKDEQRAFQRDWLQNRKDKFFKGKRCKKCSSTEDLQLHHRDPSIKIDHHIWSWAPERFWREVKKCDILCRDCHEEHNAEVESKKD